MLSNYANIAERYNQTYRGHYTCVESVVVRLADTFTVIPDKTPEEERCNGEWVVTTK